MASVRFALTRALAARSVAVPRIASRARPALATVQRPAFFVSGSRFYSDEAPTSATEGAAAAVPEDNVTPRTMFMSNIPYQLTDEELVEEIGKLSPIEKFTPVEGRKGAYRVTFENVEAMQAVVKKVNGSFWHGRMIKASPSNRTAPRRFTNPPATTIYFSRLPTDATDEELGSLFSHVDGHPRLRIMKEQSTGQLRGFGFADFTTVEEATEARGALMGKKIRGQTIYVDFAVPPGQHRANRETRERALKSDLENWGGAEN
ncbi:uncharacterized protein DNG_06931 [Cephalotrichum gorgonifer]|uniref:RRM domain-containing protein n=1 Tax=Cephalotrichum gorgonifer TaxID=2041049 RepID=A0AAE8N2H5_9PEZI|nr:uncharacterized protein DNG_06931 [Cephalotrichum gorgonifer]